MRYALGKIILLITLAAGLALIYTGYKLDYFNWVALYPNGFEFLDLTHWQRLGIACAKPTCAIVGTLILVLNWKYFHINMRPVEDVIEPAE